MRPVRACAYLLIVAGLVLYVADPGQAAEPAGKPAASEDRIEAPRGEAILRQKIRSLTDQLDKAQERAIAAEKKVAELQRQLARRPVLRIQPYLKAQPALPATPGVPKGAVPHDFNGEPYYVIPLKHGN